MEIKLRTEFPRKDLVPWILLLVHPDARSNLIYEIGNNYEVKSLCRETGRMNIIWEGGELCLRIDHRKRHNDRWVESMRGTHFRQVQYDDTVSLDEHVENFLISRIRPGPREGKFYPKFLENVLDPYKVIQ